MVQTIKDATADGETGLGLSQEAYFLIGQILNTPFALQDDPAQFCQDVYDGKVNIADVKEFQELGQISKQSKRTRRIHWKYLMMTTVVTLQPVKQK